MIDFKKYFVLIIVLTVFVSVFMPLISLAQTPPGETETVPGAKESCPPGQSPDSTGKCMLDNPARGQLVDIRDFGTLLKKIINILLMFAGAIAVIFLMIGGFQYVASRGNEESMEKAKRTVTAAIIGIVLIVMAFAIVAIVNTLLTTAP